MARRRFITPDFWDSPTATSLSAGGRLFLLGCWTAADDEGLLRWDAEEFKERLFASDAKITTAHVTGWMDEVVQNLLALPYKDRLGGSYGYLVGFERDQKVSRPVASTLPAPNPRHAATINAYAYRDRGVCPTCQTRIVPTTSGPEGLRAELDGMTGVILPAEGVPYPSEAVVVHLRCQDGTQWPVATVDGLSAGSSDAADPANAEGFTEGSAAISEGSAEGSAAGSVEVTPSDIEAPPVPEPDASLSGESPAPDPVEVETPDSHDGHADHGEQDSLFVVPAEMTKTPEGKTGNGAKATKKKRKSPATWTPDRKEVAHSILKPWWEKYGDGWPQGYNVVFGVIVSVLANKVPADDIIKAMDALGAERKPIGGGTITFALSHPSKKVREEEAFKERAASSSTEKYQQRTL